MPQADQQKSDELLLARIRDHDDQDAFQELFLRHFASLAGVARHITRDTTSAEDAAQNVMINLWSRRKALDIRTNVPGYLKQMAVREALGEKRKYTRRAGILEANPLDMRTSEQGQNLAEYHELEDNIEKAIDALPEKCGQVFRLSRFEQLSYREIADMLEISVKTVENHMGRALKDLRSALREYINILF